jgi:hypothetical protein
LKIEAEGAEGDVLEGASSATLARIRQVQEPIGPHRWLDLSRRDHLWSIKILPSPPEGARR